MWIVSSFLALAVAAPLTVVIDPGHGGRDHGAVVSRFRESEITLDVARRLARRLAADPGFRVRLTRDADEKLTLARRTRLARGWTADVFVSIHVNSSPAPNARGAEIYVQNDLPADEASAFLAHREDEIESGHVDPSAPPWAPVTNGLKAEVATIVGDLLDAERVRTSARLATALRAAWTGARQRAGDEVRQAPFFVLSKIDVPSTLVELGYLTNDDDRRRLIEPTERERMARDLFEGLQRYRESVTQGHASRPSSLL